MIKDGQEEPETACLGEPINGQLFSFSNEHGQKRNHIVDVGFEEMTSTCVLQVRVARVSEAYLLSAFP